MSTLELSQMKMMMKKITWQNQFHHHQKDYKDSMMKQMATQQDLVSITKKSMVQKVKTFYLQVMLLKEIQLIIDQSLEVVSLEQMIYMGQVEMEHMDQAADLPVQVIRVDYRPNHGLINVH